MRKLIATVTFQVVRKSDAEFSDSLNVKVYGMPGQFENIAAIEEEARRLAPQWLAQGEDITDRLIVVEMDAKL